MPEISEYPTGSGTITRESPENAAMRSARSKPARGFVVLALKISACINLIVCSIASFYVFRELGVRLIFEEDFLDYAEKVVNPFGVVLSSVLFLQAIFGFVFFLAIASVLENIISINKTLGDIKIMGSRENIS